MAALKSRLMWLAAIMLLLVPLLAACGPETPTPTPAAGGGAATPEPAATTATGTGGGTADTSAVEAEGIKADTSASGKLEFFSWWTAGGEAEGKNDILNLFKALYPNVEVVDAAVAGGGGDQAKGILKTRMQGNDPPDTFQVHGGPELLDGYVKPGLMEPVTQVYDDLNMKSAYPEQLLAMVSDGGEIYAVPANIHRGNVLFYNKKVFTDNSIQAPTTWEEFLSASEKIKAAGVAPLAVGGKDTWAVTMLFEDVLLAEAGADKFNQLMAGEADWTDAAVVEAFTVVQQTWENGYINEDFAARTWDEAAGQVLKGEAAMTIMGDWAKGYFQANSDTWADEIGWVPSPGTTGIFKVITDAFGMPKGAKNPENTRNFLKLLGSKTGQVTFNLRKGSIPARTDVDTSQFDVYMKDAAKDFGAATALVGSAPHGSGTVEAFASALNQAVNTFVANPADMAAAAAALQVQAADLLK